MAEVLETTMASVPTDRERLREAPPSELLRSLLADIRLMLEFEAELAKLEVKDKGSRLGIAGGILSGAAVVALLALGTLIAAAVAGLAIVLPLWAAALIVGTLLVLVAVAMFLVGRARMRVVGSLVPTATIETAREDVAWIRREAERLRSIE
jgi:Putative Actinobacterial Holin-X, holin superfamily III